MALPPVVALEIGTSKVVVLVGEIREESRLVITGMGWHASKGVRKGEITDLENAAICVRGALNGAEESGQVVIRELYLALSGGHIQSNVNRGSTRVLNHDGEISEIDIETVMELARAINLPPDREVLHTIFQQFMIDDQKSVTNPQGLVGSRLSLDMLALHGVSNRIHNTIRVVESIPMRVQDVAFSGLCAGLAVLTPEQKETGAVVIDLGGGTTDYVAYAGKTLAGAGVLGVGGDHITNDIALAFNTSIKQAELLKIQAGSAVLDPAARTRRIEIPPEVGFPARSVGVLSLQKVINARIDEILAMVKTRLSLEKILHRVGAGVVLTGGGARLDRVCELAEEIFELPCSVGLPRDIDGLAAVMEGPEYAAAVGMIRYAFQSGGQSVAPVGIKKLFGKLFGR